MNAPPMLEIQGDIAKNLIRVRYLGHVTAAGIAPGVEQFTVLLSQVSPGFTVLTDLSDLESMELECAAQITKIMDMCLAKGISATVRVIPDSSKDIGLKILALTHYRDAVHIVTYTSLAEAERALKL